MKKGLATVHIGKNGLTEGVIEAVRNATKKHTIVKVVLLKSATRDRQEAKRIAKDICNRISTKKAKAEFRLVGYTIKIVMKKRFRK